ncbi:MAG: branched-chain amino acid ABC transporter substrate-binding protein [Chloroflexota bacterium]
MVVPFSGHYYAAGANVLFAVKLAAREWNERGGVAGYRVDVVAQDDQNDAQGSALQARKMIVDPDVVGVLGHLSPASLLAGASEYQKSDLTMITLSPIPEALAQEKPRTFGICASKELLARGIARFITESNFQRVAPVEEQSESGTTGDVFADQEITHIATQGISSGSTHQIRETARRVCAAHPDLILFSGSFVPGAGLLREVRGLNCRIAYLGGHTHAIPDFVSIAGDAVEHAYYASLALHPRDIAKAAAFTRTYRERFGVEPTAWAVIAYDATNIVLTATEQAIRRSGKPGRAAVSEALLAISDYQGLTGSITPSAKGNLANPQVHIYRITDLTFPGELSWSGDSS